MSIQRYLGNLQGGEKQLAEAYKVVQERHSREAEVHAMLGQFAQWTAAHLEGLRPLIERYGVEDTPNPERLRASLFHETRAGSLGLLQDLQDLSLLANSVRTNWTILDQAAGGMKDKEMEGAAFRFGDHLDREINWLCTQIKMISPQALIVPPDAASEAAASVPKKPTSAAIPEPLWAPLAAGLLALLVGLAGLLVGRMWLFPSLGPTAYLQAENPSHPSVRFYNVVVGHAVGLLAGFAGVFLFNAMNDPAALQDKVLTPGRLGAAVVAVFLTLLIALMIKATHPPAAATTLLVALGSLKTVQDALNLMIGVLLIAALGELLRRVRIGNLGRATVEPRLPPDAGR